MRFVHRTGGGDRGGRVGRGPPAGPDHAVASFTCRRRPRRRCAAPGERDAPSAVSGRVPRRSRRYLFPGALELAAVLACGERTLVSHRSAAALWGLGRRAAGDGRGHGGCAAAADRATACVVHRPTSSTPVTAASGAASRSPRRRAPSSTTPPHASSDEAERAIAEAFALKLVTERAAPRRDRTRAATAPAWRWSGRSSASRAGRAAPAPAGSGRCSG